MEGAPDLDRKWMYERLNGRFLSSVYAKKVDEFIEFACKQDNVMADGLLKCPCAVCRNVPYRGPDVVKLHLYKNGFRPNYYKWTFHGEDDFQNTKSSERRSVVREASNPYKNMVLDAFGSDYSWDPSIASLVRKEWKAKCARRLSGIVYKLCNDPSYSAAWCAPTLRKQMVETRGNDDDFIQKSQQCSDNRLSNDDQKIHHRNGSISIQEVNLKLEKKLNRPPTAAEVYFESHVDDSGQFVNNKTKEVWDDFEKRKAANLECDSQAQVSEDEIFFDVVGGWNEKGRVFGLGAAAQSYYEKPTLEERNSKRAKKVESLKTQVVDLTAKNEEQRKELDQTKEGLVETQTKLDETQKALSETQKALLETNETLLAFKKQVESFMLTSNPPRP